MLTLILVVGCNRDEFTKFIHNQITPKIYRFFRDGVAGLCFDGVLNLSLQSITEEEQFAINSKLLPSSAFKRR